MKPPTRWRRKGSTQKLSIFERSVEEGWPRAGMSAEIAATLMESAFDYLDAPVARVCGADVPMPYAANLEALALPTPKRVVEAAKSVLYRE